ncbi:MAG: type III pantothenate kinase [Candidatus Eremiobacteraeota bacterium]|nr:type III pantothenate kinase [Candidatus Eremiobacteraeota bacterium]
MLLAIDAGNTETKLGLFADGKRELRQMWRVTTEDRRTADEFGVFLTQLFDADGLTPNDVDAVVIASVVPNLDSTMSEACERFFHAKPSFLKPESQTVIDVQTERPAEVGADLVAAAIGAREQYGQPLIVIAFGTATAFVAVSAEGAYLGTAIAPGVGISVDALIGRAAKLPQIALVAPAQAIGRETVSSLQSGIIFGFVGQVEALIERMRAEMGGKPRVIATGGRADVIARHTQMIELVDPHLSLIGLHLFRETAGGTPNR